MISFLNDQTSFTRNLVKNISDIIYVLDLENDRLEFLNHRIDDLVYGDQAHDHPEDYALFFHDLHPDDLPRVKEHYRACALLDDGESKEIDIRLRLKDGHYRWFRIRDLVLSRGVDGAATRLTGFLRPIGPQAISIQEGTAEWEALTAVITGDYVYTLKQAYISLEMVISADADRLTNASKAHLRRIQSMFQRLNLLTDDIASYMSIREEDGNIVPVDLNECIDSTLRELGEKINTTNATIDCQLMPVILGYPHLLTILFHHLLANAFKFRKTSRPLVIQVYHQRLEGKDIPHPDAYPDRSYQKIVIRDNGTGFDPADREKIFGMFYKGHNQMAYKGSGMGLAVVRKIMSVHHGFITAEGIPDKAAEFACYFVI